MTPQPATTRDPVADSAADPDRPWVTIVWDDPINLMSYVTHVFMTVFGYPKSKAHKLMLDVHLRGKAVVSSGARERMELDVATLHGYGLCHPAAGLTVGRRTRRESYAIKLTEVEVGLLLLLLDELDDLASDP